jgi:hypothetical protein
LFAARAPDHRKPTDPFAGHVFRGGRTDLDATLTKATA